MPILVKYKVEAMSLLIKGGKIAAEEGPLVPGDVLIVDGVIAAVGEGLDVPPEAQVIEAEGLFAVCIQHELDHLNGKLFIDHLRPLQRKIIKTKLKKKAFDKSKN